MHVQLLWKLINIDFKLCVGGLMSYCVLYVCLPIVMSNIFVISYVFKFCVVMSATIPA